MSDHIKTHLDVEQGTLIKFLENRNEIFNPSLVNLKRTEPTDISYNGENYQITIGNREEIEERRKIISKEGIKIIMNRIDDNTINKVLYGALQGKSKKSSMDVVLLIDVEGGYISIESVRKNLSNFKKDNQELFMGWKCIYAVFPDQNLLIS